MVTRGLSLANLPALTTNPRIATDNPDRHHLAILPLPRRGDNFRAYCQEKASLRVKGIATIKKI